MRKGLSQIFYLIVAASVMMMIWMVVTFGVILPEDNNTEPEESDTELAVATAVEVAEDYTWKQCSVDSVYDYGDKEVWLDCCDDRVTENGTSYRACEDVTVFRNQSSGGVEVR